MFGSALAREMVTPEDVNAIALSSSFHSSILFKGARREAKYAVGRDEVDRITSLSENERTAQEALILAKDKIDREKRAMHDAHQRKQKRWKEAEEKGRKPPSSYRKRMAWDDRLDQLRAYRRTLGRWHRHDNESSAESILGRWLSDQNRRLKDQTKISKLRENSFDFKA